MFGRKYCLSPTYTWGVVAMAAATIVPRTALCQEPSAAELSAWSDSLKSLEQRERSLFSQSIWLAYSEERAGATLSYDLVLADLNLPKERWVRWAVPPELAPGSLAPDTTGVFANWMQKSVRPTFSVYDGRRELALYPHRSDANAWTGRLRSELKLVCRRGPLETFLFHNHFPLSVYLRQLRLRRASITANQWKFLVSEPPREGKKIECASIVVEPHVNNHIAGLTKYRLPAWPLALPPEADLEREWSSHVFVRHTADVVSGSELPTRLTTEYPRRGTIMRGLISTAVSPNAQSDAFSTDRLPLELKDCYAECIDEHTRQVVRLGAAGAIKQEGASPPGTSSVDAMEPAHRQPRSEWKFPRLQIAVLVIGAILVGAGVVVLRRRGLRS